MSTYVFDEETGDFKEDTEDPAITAISAVYELPTGSFLTIAKGWDAATTSEVFTVSGFRPDRPIRVVASSDLADAIGATVCCILEDIYKEATE